MTDNRMLVAAGARSKTQIDDAVELMRMEYAEFPELKLTFWQVQRLWRLSDEECAAALKTLVETRFLVRTSSGMYVLRAYSSSRASLGADYGRRLLEVYRSDVRL